MKNRDIAEDITQETFLRYFAKTENGKPDINKTNTIKPGIVKSNNIKKDIDKTNANKPDIEKVNANKPANTINPELNLPYLYTIARNLCVDEYRKNRADFLSDNIEISDTKDMENEAVTSISVKNALDKLSEQERELLLLRYVNDVPVSDISRIYNISRFAVYRKLLQAEKKFKEYYG